MGEEVAFAPASEFTIEQLTQAFNIGFTGYYLPMTQTPEALTEMIRENDVLLGASLALLVDGELAGIGLAAVREDRSWIAGMGVGPQWRGRGLGRQLLTRLLDNLRRMGVHSAQLEVLTVNTPALALYRSLGFHDIRELRVYQGPLRAGADIIAMQAAFDSLQMRHLAPQVAFRDFTTFHQVAPVWQREGQTLSQMRRITSGVGFWDGEQLRAYAVYARQPSGLVIFDAGSNDSSPDTRQAHVTALLLSLAPGQMDMIVRAINVPPGDALGDALDALGCSVTARQIEMSRLL
jgi:ribosomal protein S18 acetylase RimI-like enzyme